MGDGMAANAAPTGPLDELAKDRRRGITSPQNLGNVSRPAASVLMGRVFGPLREGREGLDT